MKEVLLTQGPFASLALLLLVVHVAHMCMRIVSVKAADFATARLAALTASFSCLGLVLVHVCSAIAENSYAMHAIAAYSWTMIGVLYLLLAKGDAKRV